MKRLMIFLVLAIFSAASVWGQDEEQGQYLLPEFQNGRVVFKNGTSTTAQLNYSLISNLFVFIDTDDGDEIKEFMNTSDVGNIIIGSRVFQLNQHGEAVEVLRPKDPVILARYSGKSADRGQESGYGGRSQTSSIRSVASIHTGGIAYSLKGDDRWLITELDMEYQVERDGKMKRFSVSNQFLKIHPKQNRAAIEEFIAARSIDFDSVEQVVELCNFAESLD